MKKSKRVRLNAHRLIAELKKGGNDLTQDQLDRINKAFDEVNAKNQ
jgi:hypothetical protein